MSLRKNITKESDPVRQTHYTTKRHWLVDFINIFQYILKLFRPQVLKRCFFWYSQYWLWSRLIPYVFCTDTFYPVLRQSRWMPFIMRVPIESGFYHWRIWKPWSDWKRKIRLCHLWLCPGSYRSQGQTSKTRKASFNRRWFYSLWWKSWRLLYRCSPCPDKSFWNTRGSCLCYINSQNRRNQTPVF